MIRCSSWFVEKNPSIYQTLIEDSVIEQHKDKSPDGVQTPLVAPMHHEGGGNTAQMVHQRTKSSSTDRNLFNLATLTGWCMRQVELIFHIYMMWHRLNMAEPSEECPHSRHTLKRRIILRCPILSCSLTPRVLKTRSLLTIKHRKIWARIYLFLF